MDTVHRIIKVADELLSGHNDLHLPIARSGCAMIPSDIDIC